MVATWHEQQSVERKPGTLSFYSFVENEALHAFSGSPTGVGLVPFSLGRSFQFHTSPYQNISTHLLGLFTETSPRITPILACQHYFNFGYE
jgi:hypothetical protein